MVDPLPCRICGRQPTLEWDNTSHRDRALKRPTPFWRARYVCNQWPDHYLTALRAGRELRLGKGDPKIIAAAAKMWNWAQEAGNERSGS